MSAVERVAEEAAREEAERRHPEGGQEWVSGIGREEFAAGFQAGAAWQAARMPTVERVEALCRLLVDEGHMTTEGQRQVVALWGAL